MGAPGSHRASITTDLVEQMTDDKQTWSAISPGALFKKEIDKKTETGKRIQQCWNEYHYGKYAIFSFFERYIIIVVF